MTVLPSDPQLFAGSCLRQTTCDATGIKTMWLMPFAASQCLNNLRCVAAVSEVLCGRQYFFRLPDCCAIAQGELAEAWQTPDSSVLP